MARPVTEINAGSMADIAFLLLIFFLVTTTMDVDSGISRMLPPPPPPGVKPPPIKERNIFKVMISSKDWLMVEGKRSDVSQIKEMTKEFFVNPRNDENLSEKKVKNIPLLGDIPVSKGVISLKNDRGTSYEMYISVQNELAAAVRELRDEFAQKNFGKKFANLNEEQSKAVKKAVPMAISEAEPENVGGE
jgi:biopolymer transport protein ExbD